MGKMYIDDIVFVSVCPPYDSISLSTMNASEDIKEYESLQLKIAIRSELIEDLTVNHWLARTLEQISDCWIHVSEKKIAPDHRARHMLVPFPHRTRHQL